MPHARRGIFYLVRLTHGTGRGAVLECETAGEAAEKAKRLQAGLEAQGHEVEREVE